MRNEQEWFYEIGHFLTNHIDANVNATPDTKIVLSLNEEQTLMLNAVLQCASSSPIEEFLFIEQQGDKICDLHATFHNLYAARYMIVARFQNSMQKSRSWN